MLSYRHAFHAGNHADVLKHMVLIALLRYMNQKDAPYMVIDTHAGAGAYQLDTGYAVKSGEAQSGIVRLWGKKDLPDMVADYVNVVKEMNPDGKLRYYPGSPYCADKVLREQDRIRLFELHPSDYKLLDGNFQKLQAAGGRSGGRGKRIMIQHDDGFESLKSLLPPPSRRGLVLIDPPYEVKEDYRRVKQTLEDALKRFATGTFAIWYPALQRMESRQLPEKLKRLPGNGWLNVTLSVSGPAPDGFGLRSSGMFIINPPWTLEAQLRQVMPYLVSVLGTDKDAGFTLESGSTQPVDTGTRRV
jgi:23S rRNA (adenine2030-N6)-methyltransferase